jgi:uncharacterized protein
MRKFDLHDGKKGAALTVRVTPRARKTEFSRIMDDGTLRIRIAETEGEEKTNAVLLAFLAKVLGVARKRLDIVAGENGLDKIVSVLDLSAEDASQRISDWVK